MRRTIVPPFSQNLSRFIGSSWLGRSQSMRRISKAARPHMPGPIEPLERVSFAMSEGYATEANFDGMDALTRQLLANDVLDSLLQMRSDLLDLEDMTGLPSNEPEANRAIEAYQRALDSLPDDDADSTPN